MKETFPAHMEAILWPYRFNSIDLERDAIPIIIQVINYGTLEHWRWLKRRYGVERIRSVIATLSPGSLRPQALGLAGRLLGGIAVRHAPRGAH